MFSGIFFLILALMVISFSPEGNGNAWIESPFAAFLLGMILYLILLFGIYFQNRLLAPLLRRHKELMLTLTNLALLGFLAVYHFVFASHRYFMELPFIIDSQGLIALYSLVLYLFGLAVFHYSAFLYGGITQSGKHPTPCSDAITQLRILVPFAIPFILFTFLTDLMQLYPNDHLQDLLNNHAQTPTGMFLFIAIALVFMVAMMLLFHPVVQKIWNCAPLEKGVLRTRLENLCNRARFKHAGLKRWTVMDGSLTAAIIGVFPPFRYVMFTRRLTEEVSPDAIEAILAHEIGHSYRKHLLLYPFIVLGMMVCVGMFSAFFSEGITQYLALQDLFHPSSLWAILYPFAMLIPYALIIGLYLRYIFGYFSRLFERQADLHVFTLNIPPEHMIEALDTVATLSGNIHQMPSWHHHSIEQRIDFLQEAIDDRRVVQNHHKRVRNALWRYFGILTIGLLFLLSSLFPKTSPFEYMNDSIQEISGDIRDLLTGPVRGQLTTLYADRVGLDPDDSTVQEVLSKSFTGYGAPYVSGIAEYYAAEGFLEKKRSREAALMMIEAWDRFDFKEGTEEVTDAFRQLNARIIAQGIDPELGNQLKERE